MVEKERKMNWWILCTMWMMSVVKGFETKQVDPSNVNFYLNSFKGIWKQDYHSLYVELAHEVDWKCIEVEVTLLPNHTIDIQRNYLIHGNKDLKSSQTIEFHYEYTGSRHLLVYETVDSKRKLATSYSDLWIREWGPINKDGFYEYVILLGMDNQTSYVWTREYEWRQSEMIQEILERLHEWKFDYGYKLPIPTYTEFC